MENLNATTLKDLQGEVTTKVDLLDVVSSLNEHIFSGKTSTIDQRTRSIGKERPDVLTLQRKIEEL